MRCMNAVGTAEWRQEWYETASGDAARRARQLRAAGYRVTVQGMGPQVTPVGTVRSTLVSIQPGTHADVCGLPEVTLADW